MKTHTLTESQTAAHDSGDARQEDALMADLRAMAADLGETVEVSHPGGFVVGVFEAPIQWDKFVTDWASLTDVERDRYIETGSMFA